MNSFVIHGAKEVKIKEPRKFGSGKDVFYWQTIEITHLDGHKVEISIESSKPLLKETVTKKEKEC